MSRYIVEVVDPGCDCCSFVPVDSFENEEDIPARYLTDKYSIYDLGEEDD